jgi:hypothetical protein
MAKDFKIARPLGQCCKCRADIPPGDPIIAVARLGEDEILREDYHPGCWVEPTDPAAAEFRDVLGVWKTKVPQPEEKKRLLVDNNILMNFFERLAGAEDETRINFRYVLTLILMRKKLLAYEGMTRREDGTELWKMRVRGQNTMHEVVDPKLDEDRIAEVSASLGDIMEGDFE